MRITRLDFGYFVRPATETDNRRPRVEPAYGFLIDHPDGAVIFDTGIGAGDAEVDAHYRPRRRDLADALAAAGRSPDEIQLVINSHLHFDHCGGNPALAGREIVVQRAERSAAETTNYTIPALVDFPGAKYLEITSETEILSGIRVIPTPGHTNGHQSLVVRRPNGTVVLAGQAYDVAADFGSDVLAIQARRDGVADPLPTPHPWVRRLLAFDPSRVCFAHDASEWIRK